MNPRNDVKNPMVYQELKHLRAQNEELRKRIANSPAAVAAPAGPVVEHRIGPEVLVALRNLVVANENFFGEVKGENTPKPSHELAEALRAAAKMFRKPKKA